MDKLVDFVLQLHAPCPSGALILRSILWCCTSHRVCLGDKSPAYQFSHHHTHTHKHQPHPINLTDFTAKSLSSRQTKIQRGLLDNFHSPLTPQLSAYLILTLTLRVVTSTQKSGKHCTEGYSGFVFGQ